MKKPEIDKKGKIGEVSWEENYERLDDWTKNRIRFHWHGEKLKDIGDPARNIAYSLYRRALIATNNGDLIEKYDLDHAATDLNKLKNISEYYKKKGPAVERRWRYLVDLHRLNDFIKPPPAADFYDDVHDWVTRRPIHTWNGDEALWNKKFEEHLRKVLFSSGKMPGEITSVDKFIKNGDMWATAGSGFEPEATKLKVWDHTRQLYVTPTKNKWSVRWGLSNYNVKRLLFKKRKQICKAVPKAEPGKVRAVISSDLALYLKMSFVSKYLDQILQGRDDSTLFMGKRQRFDLWQQMAFDGTWRMPIDQSEFDKNVSKAQIDIAMKVIKELLLKYNAPDDVLEIMDLITDAVDGGHVIVDGRSIPISNGILSGWRWTAMLDTFVNLAEVSMAKEWVESNSTIRVNILALNAQGDDDWLKFKTRKEAIAMWLAYESFGLFVNPGKFFLDTVRDEYLRRVMDGDKITGYPARSISSICFRNPVSERETVGPDRVRQTLNKWKLFAERLDAIFNGGWFYSRWQQDSVQGTRGMTKVKLDKWFNLHAIDGGLGWDGGARYATEIPVSPEKISDVLEIQGDGYLEYTKFLDEFGIHERNVRAFALSTLDFQSGKLPPWVKYIITADELNTDIEHGLDWAKSGSIAIGQRVRDKARAKRIRWYPSINKAKATVSLGDWTWTESIPLEISDIKINAGRVRSLRPLPIDALSMTSAQLSEDFSKTFSNYGEFNLDHKPKSWVIDFFKGRLKAKVGYRSGWGVDVVGGVADELLNAAIAIFMSTNRPTLKLWDSLLAGIDAAIPKKLNELQIRIIE